MAAGNWVDWNTGDLVTAASFQDIQDSIVFIYADDSAANTALTNKVEGTAYYNTTDNVLKIWDGAAWTEVGGGGGGLSEADTWIMTADLAASANPISANLSRPTGTLQNYLGTGMTESSGIFTFPSTGYWLIMFHGWVTIDSNSSSGYLYIMTTNDNSVYDDIAQARFYGNSGFQSTIRTSAIIDVTDLANDKVRFRFAETGASTLKGGSIEMQTGFHFIKLGDT